MTNWLLIVAEAQGKPHKQMTRTAAISRLSVFPARTPGRCSCEPLRGCCGNIHCQSPAGGNLGRHHACQASEVSVWVTFLVSVLCSQQQSWPWHRRPPWNGVPPAGACAPIRQLPLCGRWEWRWAHCSCSLLLDMCPSFNTFLFGTSSPSALRPAGFRHFSAWCWRYSP